MGRHREKKSFFEISTNMRGFSEKFPRYDKVNRKETVTLKKGEGKWKQKRNIV